MKSSTDNQINMLAQTLKCVNECISITDIDNYIIYVNDAFLRTYGYTEDELKGKHISIVKPTETRHENLKTITEKTIEGGWQGDLINRRKDGSTFPVRVSSSPVFDCKGKLIAMVGVTIDITESLETKKKLQESENWIRLITENSPDIIYVFLIEENRNIYINRSLVKILGYDDGELNDYSADFFKNIIHPDDLIQFETFYKTINDWEAGFVFGFEYRLRAKNGNWRWFKGNEKEFQRKNGKVISLIGTVQEITFKKEAEIKLRESEEKFRLIAENTGDTIVVINEKLTFSYISPSMFKLSGYKPEECFDKDLRYVFNENTYEQIKAFSATSPAEHKEPAIKTLSLELEMKHKNNAHIWVEATLSLMNQDSRQAASIIAVLRDITRRKKDEEQLLFQSLILDQIADLVTVTDLNGIITYVNNAVAKMMKKSREELLGKSVVIYGEDTSRGVSQNDIIEITNTNDSWRGEMINYNAAGEELTLEVKTQVLCDKLGNKIGLCGISTDITEYKKTEKKLKESVSMFQNLFNNMIEGFSLGEIITDEIGKPINWRFITVNQAHEYHTGLKSEEIIGKCVKDFFPDIEQYWLDFYGEVALTGKPNHFIGYNHNTGRYYEINAFSTEKGKFAAIFSDYTVKKEAELKLLEAKDKAEAADRLKTAFMNNISHEVRTPLNGIIGFADLIAEETVTPDEKNLYLKMLKQSNNRLIQTITDYMDISLIASGNLEVHPATFQPENLLLKLHDTYLEVCNQKKLKFSLLLPDDTDKGQLTTDEELLRKMLQHLLDNATKFTSQGSISLGMKKHSKTFEFFVKDTGQGIRQENLETIFKPFSQEDNRDTRGHEGSGLGLAIVRGIADLLGGKIHAESIIDKETTFTFTLPVNYFRKSPAEKPEKAALSTTDKKQVLLIAEDDFTSFKYFDVAFSKLPVKLLHAPNGKEAVKMCQQNPDINCVLMDLKMPEMDGFEATRQIKKLRSDLPVIAQTAFALSGDEYRAREAGCDDYLPKPISKKSLLEKLRQFGFWF
ncbi:MAG: PAS domain-containing sensor histidine kinase [Sphingobacteriia bacterium]|nr:PAS domain-containing sensor histidine kinase [Sphingobacteriia bacterium]